MTDCLNKFVTGGLYDTLVNSLRYCALLAISLASASAQQRHSFVADPNHEYPEIFSHPDKPCSKEQTNAQFSVRIDKELDFVETAPCHFYNCGARDFDQGEDFYGHARNRRDSSRVRRDVRMLEKVVALSEADMRLTPALQLADLFAWCISHNDNPSKRLWHRSLNDLPTDPSWESVYLDEDYLANPTSGALSGTDRAGVGKRE